MQQMINWTKPRLNTNTMLAIVTELISNSEVGNEMALGHCVETRKFETSIIGSSSMHLLYAIMLVNVPIVMYECFPEKNCLSL